ncbi:MAG: phytanoyl-CoA dioxygenase family protein [Alphaproteobacteria bacterium]|nr:phytanoyl-CoA dioxygenase family protein [Alphaproteobacteria bacterium]
MSVGDSLLAVVKTPLWLAAIATGAKSFVDNPILGSERLNRWGLHVGRVRLAARLAGMRRRWLARRVPPAQRQAFERDGFVVLQDFLPAPEFERLRAEVLDDAWEAREMRQGSTVTRRVFLDVARLGRAKPALAAFLGRQDMRSLIRYVAATGGEPAFSIQCILANAAGAADDPQCVVHADTFHATAKAWFFLQDVGPDDGPFLYVPGSHALTPQRVAWEREQSLAARQSARRDHAEGSFRISVDDLHQLGLPQPRSIAVRANTLVIADTFGFHGRTPSPKPTQRIEVYGTLRRNPFLLWTGLDPLSLPPLRSRLGSVLTALDRMGIVPMPWRPVGQIRLDAPPKI